MTGEEWRPVVGYETLYEVSSLGRVRSLTKRNRWSAGHILRSSPNSDGYSSLQLRDSNRKRKRLAVHKMVTRAFLGDLPDGLMCRHLDGNRQNPALSNLCYGSHQDNIDDMKRHGTDFVGERNPNVKLSASQVEKIRERLSHGERYSVIASEYKIDRSHVYRIKARVSW